MEYKKIKVYKFNELSSKVQDKLVMQEIELMKKEFTIDENEFYIEEIECNGFLNPKIYYSGFNTQDSGLVFDCDSFDDEFLFNEFSLDNSKFSSSFIDKVKKSVYTFNITKNSYSNQYNHERTREFKFTTFEDEFTEFEDEFTEYVENIRTDLCLKLYFILKNEYEFLESEDNKNYIINNSDIFNDVLFYENGTIFNENLRGAKNGNNK